MNDIEFTDLCFNILTGAYKRLDPRIIAELKNRKIATSEHPSRCNSLVFPVWGTVPSGFWNPNYGTYTIVHDPEREMVEASLFQVRFIFFLKRGETGSGMFSPKVEATLKTLPNTRGFRIAHDSDNLIIAKKTYNPPEPYSGWVPEAAEDLAWLIEFTYPKFRGF